MDANQIVESWHDFYIAMTTAAVTLVGLLFVAVSLNIETIIDEKRGDLMARATSAFSNFVFIMIFSLVFLVPDTGTNVGWSLLFVSIAAMVRLAGIDSRMLRAEHRKVRGLQLAWRFILPAAGYVGVAVIGVLVTQHILDALSWLVGILIELLVTALGVAWDLLVTVGRDKHTQQEANTARERAQLVQQEVAQARVEWEQAQAQGRAEWERAQAEGRANWEKAQAQARAE